MTRRMRRVNSIIGTIIMKINRVIHQMWFDGLDQAPSKYKPGMDSWKRENKDYQYIFWDKFNISAFIENYYPEYSKKWHSLDQMIKKCDSARYFILHKLGGVYADLDTFAHKGIDSLILDQDLDNYSIILSEESLDPQAWKSEVSKKMAEEHNLRRIIGNAIMITEKNQNFWLNFLDKSFKKSSLPILESFATWHLSKFIEEYSGETNIKILPYDFLLSVQIKPNSYVTHSYDASWFDLTKDRPWIV